VSEPEGFLSRWARLKREAGEALETPDAAAPDVPADASPETARAADAPAPAAPPAEPAFDLASLPPIESITATTDIRAFLAPGVPPELARAALRRAWVADPGIRDFVGIAENQWDFNDPGAIPGFGPLGPLDDVRRLLAQVIGDPLEPAEQPVTGTGEKNSPPEVEERDSVPIAATEGNSTGGDFPSVAAAVPSPEPDPAAAAQTNETIGAVQEKDSPDPDPAPTAGPVRRGHGGALPK
jgi:hypothetical protein